MLLGYRGPSAPRDHRRVDRDELLHGKRGAIGGPGYDPHCELRDVPRQWRGRLQRIRRVLGTQGTSITIGPPRPPSGRAPTRPSTPRSSTTSPRCSSPRRSRCPGANCSSSAPTAASRRHSWPRRAGNCHSTRPALRSPTVNIVPTPGCARLTMPRQVGSSSPVSSGVATSRTVRANGARRSTLRKWYFGLDRLQHVTTVRGTTLRDSVLAGRITNEGRKMRRFDAPILNTRVPGRVGSTR